MINRLPPLVTAATAIRNGELAPTELVEYCLERIQRLDPQIRAWVGVDDTGARREAERLTALARQGRSEGALHGIPVGIKDIIDIAGWHTRCGSPLRQDRIAAADAEIVTRLRQAGAILLGKTVTTEFASFDPAPTRNPWNLERTPGGSSSGSAAAVALEMCPAAIGTQTGGSIVRPASYCGVVGFKPTFGAITLDGIEPLSWHMDHVGPITRRVADAALLFQVLSGQSIAVPATDPAPRLVRLGGFFDDRADDWSRRCFQAAVERLVAAGIPIESPGACPVQFEQLLASHSRIIAVDAAAHHRSAYEAAPRQFGPKISSLIEEGLQYSAVDYSDALRHQARVQSELASLFAEGRILIMPSTTTPAPGRETTGDPAFNSLWSFAGVPEITIPCGLADDGLPCGMQFVGPAGSEPRVLAAAAHCEAILDFRAQPSGL